MFIDNSKRNGTRLEELDFNKNTNWVILSSEYSLIWKWDEVQANSSDQTQVVLEDLGLHGNPDLNSRTYDENVLTTYTPGLDMVGFDPNQNFRAFSYGTVRSKFN